MHIAIPVILAGLTAFATAAPSSASNRHIVMQAFASAKAQQLSQLRSNSVALTCEADLKTNTVRIVAIIRDGLSERYLRLVQSDLAKRFGDMFFGDDARALKSLGIRTEFVLKEG